MSLVSRVINSALLKNDLKYGIKSLRVVEGIDADIKVSVYDIKTGLKANANGKRTGWAASIIKLPVMISTLQEIEKGNLSLNTKLKKDSKYTLEYCDMISTLQEGTPVPIKTLLEYMITASDNEATNMLADEIGIQKINRSMWDLGLKRTMLGHLLCPNVPRYTSKFNPDGSNITCPNDMVKIMRHVYDGSFSKLSPKVRELSDKYLSKTNPFYLNKGVFKKQKIKAKVGIISDPKDGNDTHEVGIINDHLIVCIMLNKINQKRLKENKSKKNTYSSSLNNLLYQSSYVKPGSLEETNQKNSCLDLFFGQEESYFDDFFMPSGTSTIFNELMDTIGLYTNKTI